MSKKKFLSSNEAASMLRKTNSEFAVVNNPSYIFPHVELYPLAPKLIEPAKSIHAIVMDMDGTTTTTEEICIHSLEYMVRKITDRMEKTIWGGLDHVKDYPHIIGNSTTKHVEYLINTYHSEIKYEKLKYAFIYAALWTLIIGKDESRKKDVTENIINLGCSNLLTEKKYLQFLTKPFTERAFLSFVKYAQTTYSKSVMLNSKTDIVRAAIDIYYQRYHDILLGITMGNSKQLAAELLEDKTKHLIEPLPGVGIFLALTKGLLEEEVINVAEPLINQYYLKNPNAVDKFNILRVTNKLLKLSKEFTRSPLKIAVVTSSIYYEADIVLTEVFNVLCEEVKKWKITPERKKAITKAFSSYRNFYDGVVTASDSNEIRLKPHRDLYSIALHKLSISTSDFDKVIGFEDSESGTIAIRAAGIGRCMAVPFAQTAGHNLDAAAFILNGGLPEVILKHNLFIK